MDTKRQWMGVYRAVIWSRASDTTTDLWSCHLANYLTQGDEISVSARDQSMRQSPNLILYVEFQSRSLYG